MATNFWDLVEQEKKKKKYGTTTTKPTGAFGDLVEKYTKESTPFTTTKKKKKDEDEDDIAPVKTRKEKQTEARAKTRETSSNYGMTYAPGQTMLEQAMAHHAKNDDVPMMDLGVQGQGVQTTLDDGKIDFFQKGAFEDGFQASDLITAPLGTIGDAALGLVKGFARTPEGLADAVANYIIAPVSDAVGADKFADRVRDAASVNLVDELTAPATDFLNDYSMLGRTTDAIAEGVGQVGFTVASFGAGQALGMGAKGASALSQILMGVGSAGSGSAEAYANDATDAEALSYGAMAGAAEVVFERLFGGMGNAINMVGFNKGVLPFDDMAAKGLAKFVKGQTGKNVVEFLVKSGFEGLEEVGTGFTQAVAKKLTYMSEEDFAKILEDENLFEQFVVGSLTSGISQTGDLVRANKSGSDFVTGLNADEQTVLDKATEALVAEREKKYGRKLTNKEKTEARKEIRENLEQGGLDVDSIAEILGGESYEAFKAESDSFFGSDAYKAVEEAQRNEKALPELQKRYDELNAKMPEKKTGAEQNEEATLLERINAIKNAPTSEELKAKLDPVAQKRLVESYRKMHTDAFARVKGSRLAESYAEQARSQEKLDIDTSKYKDENARKTVQAIIDSGLGDNSNAFKHFLDLVAQVSAKHKTIYFDMTSDERLFGTDHSRSGLKTNGYKLTDENGTTIVINKDAANPLRVVVGHEFAHVLEKSGFYDAIAETALKFAELKEGKASLDARIQEATRIYKDDKNTTPEKEVVADLIGEYVFTDYEFISNLAKTNRKGFMKLFDEVKYLARVATAGSKVYRELAKLKNNFERAYREFNVSDSEADGKVQHSYEKTVGNTNYSIENGRKRKYNKRSRYSETETLFLSWENGSAPVGEVKKFVRYGKTHYYEKTENGSVELSRSQYNERNGAYVENIDRRAERRFGTTADYDESTQRGTPGHSDGNRDSSRNAAVFGQTIRERLPDVSAGSVSSALGHDSRTDITQTEYNDEASDDSDASFVTFSNDYNTIRRFMKDGDTEGSDVQYSLVRDKKTIDFLENQDHLTVYKAMVLIDGKLYPPMASQNYVEEEYTTKSGEKKTRRVRKLKNPSVLGQWQQSEERPDLVTSFVNPSKKYPEGYGQFDLLKSNGKTTGGVAYNPYEHTSNIVLNDQFAEAYQRPELVTVEYHIPTSELTSGYKAQYAKDPVGLTDWKAGGVAQKLKNSHRDVYLTRWSKPVRVLSDAEVAQKYKEILDKEDGISVPWNVVTPSLRTELEKIGVPIDYSDIKAGSTIRSFEAAMRGDYDKKKSKNVQYSMSKSENVGYHAGDLGKSEDFFDMTGTGRATGHFGTGTYFVGDEAQLSDRFYRNRPHEKVDFGKYNLFKVGNYEEGSSLHSFLMSINNNILHLAEARKTFDEYYDSDKNVMAAADDAQFGEWSEDEDVINNRKVIDEYIESNFTEVEKQKLNEAAENDYDRAQNATVSEYWKQGLEDDYNRSVKYFGRTESLEEYVARRVASMEESIANSKKLSVEDWYYVNTFTFLKEHIEASENYRDWYRGLTLRAMQSGVWVGEDKLRGILDSIYDTAKGYGSDGGVYMDSPSTMFMKALGYEGIDVRGVDGLDNFTYGSVIYDLKDEDLARKKEIGTARYSLSDDTWSQIRDMQTEVNRLTESIREFEASAEYKEQMRKISEAVDSGNIDAGVKEYQRWLKGSGYGDLTDKRNALRDELEELRKKAEENQANEALEAERTAIEKSGLSEADYFRKQAVKEFGYTPYFYDAGYIVTNGKMLNFSGEKGQHFGSRGQDHRAIGTIYAETDGTDALNRFVNEGNIRISPESPGIDVSATAEPTKEQYATIKKFVYQYADKGYFSVDISDENGRVVGSLEYENRIYPAKVIDDLKHYYETGEIRQQSDIGKFHYSFSEDSQGKAVDKELQNLLRFSKVRDENGRLIPMYHGTPNGSIAQFKAGTYFTDNKEYADRYQNPSASSISTGKTVADPKTFEVYLDIRKPFDLNDPEARRIYIEEYIKGGNAIGINPYLSDAEYAKIKSIDWTEGEDLRDFLIDNEYDYDGLVLDEGADGGYGEEVKYRGKSYVIFRPDQAITPAQHSLATASNEESAESKFLKYTRGGVRRDTFADKLADLAPVRQDVATQEAAPVTQTETPEEMFPDAPLDAELDSLIQRKEALEEQMLEMSRNENFDNFQEVSAEWEAVSERINALEKEASEADADRMDSLMEEIPPEPAEQYDGGQADVIPITKKLAADIARDIRSSLGLSNKHMADVRSIIDRYTQSEFPSREQLFEELKEKFGAYTESVSDDSVQEAKSYLRSYPIYVDNYIKSEIVDYEQLRKDNGKHRRLRFSEDGTEVDVLYHELNELYPHLFPESILNPTDQFLQIVNVANMDTVTNVEQELPDEAIWNVADSIMSSVGEYRQAQKLNQANKHSRESFGGLMQDADAYVPPIDLDRVLANRRNPVGTDTFDAPVAEIYDTQHKKGVAEGQQAMWNDPVPETITRKVLHERKVAEIDFALQEFGGLEEVLKNAKNLSTWQTVDNTPQRVMKKALGFKEGDVLADLTVNKVAQATTEGTKWLNTIVDRKGGLLAQLSKRYNIKPKSKEIAAAQMYAEGFYVNENDEYVRYGDAELAQDFPDAKVQANIKALVKDPRIRQFYDSTLAEINASRTRNAYPEIPRLDNYYLHYRAMGDTFSQLGLPFNPNDIKAKDLPTDLNGVTADLKPGQPYFASSMHRKGKKTTYDLFDGMERYARSAMAQIYYIDHIQTLRALRNHVADTYGQANGLEGLDALTEEEAQERIEQVFGSHLSTFAKFLNEEANVLAGKTALIDRGMEGILGRRAIEFINTLNNQTGKNLVGYNVSSSLTNFDALFRGFAKSNKADFVKAFGQFVYNKVSRRSDGFAENSPVIIRRKGSDVFNRTLWQKLSDPGYVMMSVVDEVSTEIVARAKYNELTRKGMDSQQAHFETDKWVSSLMGDRSLGQQPQLYNSKVLGLLTKFQLEVRNNLDSMFYDSIQDAKVSNEHIQNSLARNAKTAAKATWTIFSVAVAQHVFGKAFESVAGYNPTFDIIDIITKAFGWDDDEEDEDTVGDNLEQAFQAMLEDLPYTSIFRGGRIPIQNALPIEELITGKDQYGNEKSRWQTVAEAAPYYLLPGGYGQIKKSVAGLNMFSDEHPVAGSYTKSGNLRFPVEDTIGNRVQAAVFGQYANENARYYFDNDIAPLKPNQIQEYMDVDLPIRDYWDYLEGLKGKDTLGEKLAYIDSLDLPIRKQNILANNLTDRTEPIDMADWDKYDGLEEYNYAKKYPEKHKFLESIGISYDEYESFDDDTKEAYSWAYQNPEKYTMSKAVTSDLMEYKQYTKALSAIKADKDQYGDTISGSAKTKKAEYINNLNLDYGQKIILYRSLYNSQDDRDAYNADIVEYLNSRNDLTYDEIVTILKELDFTVLDDGTVLWD